MTMTPEQQRAIVARIAKLLRLSRGTDHAAEAAAAMAKAAEIAAEAGLALDGIDADATVPRIAHEAGGARRRSHRRVRCHGVLRRHFGVDVIGSSKQGAIYVGPAINIVLARHIEEYLVRQCAEGWSAMSGVRRRCRAGGRRAYECGFFLGIDKVLQARPIRNDNPALAGEIEKYIADNFRIRSSPLAPAAQRYAAFMMAGLAAGRNTPCSRPVDGAAAAVMIGGGA